jgi:8-hydroxy-5-deazaflavin:NADPH oxidoreductase
MEIAIVGAGHIGTTTGAKLAHAGHAVVFTYSRDPQRLVELAAGLPGARAAQPAAATSAEVIVLSVPWSVVDDALQQLGSLAGKVVIDTTNQFGPTGVLSLPNGLSAAEFNSRRAPEARWVKAFNTYTARFQAEAARRPTELRPAMFYAGEDAGAKAVAAEVVRAAGFHAVDIGGWQQVPLMEAPRRPGAVYGEEYTLANAIKIADAARRDLAEAQRLADALKQPS